MNLKRRLERLESRTAQLPNPEPGGSSALAELRGELQALAERSRSLRLPATRARKAQVSPTALPFVARQTSAGELWQRLSQLGGEHRVGRVAVEDIARADASVLAELALDSTVAGSSPSHWLFIDLETTGFAGAGTLAFLVGMAGIDASGRLVVEQLLLRHPAEEPALLQRVVERISEARLVISFNGKAFDRPLLESRCAMNRLPPLPPRPHLDLLHIGRRLHRARLQSCTLGRLEREVLGFERGRDIDGSQVPAIYGHFLRSGDASEMSLVVGHNYWDVVSMIALVALYGQRCPPLPPLDLASLAFTLQRAGATLQAQLTAEAACALGGGVDALRVRAALCKSRGDTLGAVRDLEQLCEETDDPRGRLELAKLYEHAMCAPARALHWACQGTGEEASAHARRLARLQRKLSRLSSL